MTKDDPRRRDLLKLLGVGGVVFASGLVGCGRSMPSAATPARKPAPTPTPADDFIFLQLSDTHWGFEGPQNPEASHTLADVVATVNAASALVPDFVVFTGDLTHATVDANERRERMKRFKDIVSHLRVKRVVFLPGEHDAAKDRGEAFQEHFGVTHQSFDHRGVHFVTLDNVSDPDGKLGDAQLAWLEKDLASVPAQIPVVVFAHRPLFELMKEWDWFTADGDRALAILQKRANVTVFYGHIHQEHHRTTGAIAHHAARSLVFPLPAPGSVPKKGPLPWDDAHPFAGLGWREVRETGAHVSLVEHGLAPK